MTPRPVLAIRPDGAEPLLEPPVIWPSRHGFCASPWWSLSPKGPIASSAMLSLPRVIAPAAVSLLTAVHSRDEMK